MHPQVINQSGELTQAEEEIVVAKVLLIGSTEPYSGKSAAILGLASHLRQQGIRLTYGKPMGTCSQIDTSLEATDPDLEFMAEALELDLQQMPPTVLQLSGDQLLQTMSHPGSQPDYLAPLMTYCSHTEVDLVLLEGPGTLQEGEMFQLSLLNMAQQLDTQVLLISRYHSPLVVDGLLAAYHQLQGHLAGVVINDVPEDQLSTVEQVIVPFLESRQIPVLGILPSHRVLRSISVSELALQLQAEVVCGDDRLDAMVEDFAVGAMNVNSALKYFRKSDHKAVITGGDRTDIQLAALETSTLCLILTGKLPLDNRIRSRAEELEVPILSVDLDTFTTIGRIERLFGQVRLHETAKMRYVQEIMSRNFDYSRLSAHLNLTQPLASSSV